MHRLFRLAAGMVVACAVADVHAVPASLADAREPSVRAKAEGPALKTAPPEVAPQTMVQRFLARGEEPPVEYRALRRLEADNPKFKQSAWMVAWTEYDHANGLKYEVVAEGGSGYIRSKVLRAALDGEQKIWANHEPQKASLTAENYLFEAGPDAPDGLASITVKPKRKDILLVEGFIFVQPGDVELTRIEGKLSKTPSFWTRRVEVVRKYERKAGVRVPIVIESVAHVLIAGRSTFKMTYEYQTINGQQVGNPQVPSTKSEVGSKRTE